VNDKRLSDRDERRAIRQNHNCRLAPDSNGFSSDQLSARIYQPRCVVDDGFLVDPEEDIAVF